MQWRLQGARMYRRLSRAYQGFIHLVGYNERKFSLDSDWQLSWNNIPLTSTVLSVILCLGSSAAISLAYLDPNEIWDLLKADRKEP